MTPPLDEALRSLEEITRAVGLPAVSNLLPPATQQQLSEARAILGRGLHADLQTVYRWHSGVSGWNNDAALFPGPFAGVGLEFVGVDRLAESRQSLLEAIRILQDSPLQTDDVPLFQSRYEVIVLRNSTGSVYLEHLAEPGSATFPSLSDLVVWMVERWTSGAFEMDPAEDVAYLDMDYVAVQAVLAPFQV